MKNESVVVTLLRYIHDDCSDAILTNSTDELIKDYAYRDWATCEALFRVMDRPYEDAIVILSDFMMELRGFMNASKTGADPHNPFAVAFEQVEYILAMLEHPEE